MEHVESNYRYAHGELPWGDCVSISAKISLWTFSLCCFSTMHENVSCGGIATFVIKSFINFTSVGSVDSGWE